MVRKGKEVLRRGKSRPKARPAPLPPEPGFGIASVPVEISVNTARPRKIRGHLISWDNSGQSALVVSRQSIKTGQEVSMIESTTTDQEIQGVVFGTIVSCTKKRSLYYLVVSFDAGIAHSNN